MEKDFDQWNVLKKRLEGRRDVFCNTREVWWCSIGANVGAEASGKNGLFERPVLVLKVYNTQSILIVPLTSKPKNDRFHTEVVYTDEEGLMHTSWAILSHTRTISPRRLQRKLYRIDKNTHARVMNCLFALQGSTTK